MSTLARIEDKFRKLASVPLETHITQAGVREYIDDAYIYDLPALCRIWPLYRNLTVTLQTGYDSYDFDENLYLGLEPPVYVAGYPAQFFQSQASFFGYWPKAKQREQPATGNGGSVYTFTLTSTPIVRGSIFIAAESGSTQLDITDNGAGSLQGDVGVGVNAVDYDTGDVTVTFSSTIDSGNIIYVNYESQTRGLPSSVLFYDSVLTVRPVPDQPYEMTIQALVRPTSMIDSNDSPEPKEWWQYIAYIAAQKYLEDQNRREEAVEMEPFIRRERNKIMARESFQNSARRTPTIYAPGLYGQYNGSRQTDGFW